MFGAKTFLVYLPLNLTIYYNTIKLTQLIDNYCYQLITLTRLSETDCFQSASLYNNNQFKSRVMQQIKAYHVSSGDQKAAVS